MMWGWRSIVAACWWVACGWRAGVGMWLACGWRVAGVWLAFGWVACGLREGGVWLAFGWVACGWRVAGVWLAFGWVACGWREGGVRVSAVSRLSDHPPILLTTDTLVESMPFHRLAHPELGALLRAAGNVVLALRQMLRPSGSVPRTLEELSEGNGPGIQRAPALRPHL